MPKGGCPVPHPAPRVTRVGGLGRGEGLPGTRTGALGFCCPEVSKGLQRKRPLDREKKSLFCVI